MPDVICMGLQAAQDEIQDHGVFFSDSEDATGQDRLQLLDRNWVVVGQQPPAGSSMADVTPILSVVRWSEEHDCDES